MRTTTGHHEAALGPQSTTPTAWPTKAPDPAGPVPPAGAATGTGVRDRLRASLFPDPVARTTGVRARLATAVVVLLAVPLSAWRIPVGSWDSLWAEDGHIFLQSALDEPFWRPFVSTYAGYLHAFPRLVSELTAALPLEWAGHVYTFSAAALVVWVALTVWSSSAGLVRSTWLRAALTMAVVVVPAGGLEAADNVANSHFFLMFGAFWALLGRPRSRVGVLSGHLLVVLATLSDPVTLAVLPIAVARFVLLPRWRDRALSLTFLAGMAVQLVAVATSQRATGGVPSGPREMLFGYDLRVVLPHALSLGVTRRIAAHGALTVGLVAAGVVVIAVLGLLAARRNRLAAIAAAVASGAFFSIASVFSLGAAYPPVGDGRFVLGLSARYTIVPGLLLLTAWVLLADGASSRLAARLRPVVLLLATVPVLLVALVDYRQGPAEIRQGPAGWSGAVAELDRACAQRPDTVARDVEIQPGGAWVVRLDCGDLD